MKFLRPIYISITIFFVVYCVAQVITELSLKKEEIFSHTFSADAEVEVRPDIAHVGFSRREPLASSPTLAALSVSGPVSAFTQHISGNLEVEPITVSLMTYQNSQFIARAYDASQDVVMTLTDISALPALIESGINSGMNVVGRTEFTVSPQQRKVSQSQARKIANDQIMADARVFALHMNRTLIRCYEPEHGNGMGFGSGDPAVSGGMSMTDAPDLENISKFIRPLTELVIPEPIFAGTVQVAKKIAPPEVSITGTETLTCDFK